MVTLHFVIALFSAASFAKKGFSNLDISIKLPLSNSLELQSYFDTEVLV